MAKKKKNSNYVTEKNTAAHLEAEAEAKKAKGKKIARIAITATAVVLAIALAVVLIGLAFGLFDYYPEATEHLVIEIEDLGTLHVELYGKDAPKTVAHFKKLAADGYFDDLTLHTLVDGLLYGGDIEADGGPGTQERAILSKYRDRRERDPGRLSSDLRRDARQALRPVGSPEGRRSAG